MVCRPTCSESWFIGFVAFKAATICLIQNTSAIVQVKLEGRLISQTHISTPYITLKPALEPALKRSRLAFVAVVTAHERCPKTLKINSPQSVVYKIQTLKYIEISMSQGAPPHDLRELEALDPIPLTNTQGCVYNNHRHFGGKLL
jgi:hypothetical protein